MRTLYYCVLLSLGIFCNTFLQAETVRSLRVMFYNVENLFDTQDNPATQDDEFTPEGLRHWNSFCYQGKLNKLGQVIVAVGKGETPDMVGVCEVEDKKVLCDLVRHPLLRKSNYEVIHFDSPDARGIDVALLCKKAKVKVFSTKKIPVHFLRKMERKTRDILYAKCVANFDTIHLFVNHWSSNYGGVLATQHKRKKAAVVLRHNVDSIVTENSNAKILIMGDFNASPISEEIQVLLSKKTKDSLCNMSEKWFGRNIGTYKYKGVWKVIDQIIVSPSVLSGNGLFSTREDAHVFYPSFLLKQDSWGGVKPFRTYEGLRYVGGFSDHLPVYIDLYFRAE